MKILFLSKILTLIFSLGLGFSAFAKVWTSEREWNEAFEFDYSDWIASDKVYPEIFVQQSSPYFGILVDCADVSYALRAIFAYEHKLPFVVVQEGKSNTLVGNDSDRFDSIQDPAKRFVAFVNYVADAQDSRQLGFYDTYPLNIYAVRPGDVYTYSLKKDNELIEHVMMIKKINANGTFDFLYSTQKIRKSNEEFFARKPGSESAKLKLKTNFAARIAPTEESRGFRRFLWPQYLKKDPKTYPFTFAYSKAQFTMPEKAFFRMIQFAFNHSPDSNDAVLGRNLSQICEQVQDRVQSVQEAVEFMKTKTPDYCVNKDEYYFYSTPLRDFVIEQSFNYLRVEWLKISAAKHFVPATRIQKLVQAIFAERARGGELRKFCPIVITDRVTLDLHKVYWHIKGKRLSSDPQDTVLVRWGEQKLKGVSKCAVVQAAQ